MSSLDVTNPKFSRFIFFSTAVKRVTCANGRQMGVKNKNKTETSPPPPKKKKKKKPAQLPDTEGNKNVVF